MTMKKIITFSLLALAVVVGAVFFFNKSKTTQPTSEQPTQLTKVKVGYMPFAANWAMFLALDRSMFKDEGLEVEPVMFTSGTDAANALAQGDIAAHAINTYADLFNVEARTPGTFKMLIVQQLSDEMNNEALVVNKNSSITSIAQLTGKKIGITPGVFSEVMLKKAYEKEINFDKGTQLIKLPPQSQLSALESGQIDGLVAYEPLITTGLANDSIRVLDYHSYGRVKEPFPVGGYTLSTKFMEQNPEVTQKIARVLLQALEYGTRNPSETVPVIAKYTNLSEDIVAKVKQNESIAVTNLPQGYFDNVTTLYYDLGLVDTKIENANFGYETQ